MTSTKKTHKNTYKVQAVKGVIFATGGWGADNEFISASTPQYSTLESTSQKGATSESVRMLLGLGAMPVLLDIYQVGPWATPDEFGAGAASIFADYIFAEGIMVDARNGKRFVNELASRRERSEAEMKCVDQQGKPVMPFGFCSEKRRSIVRDSRQASEKARLRSLTPSKRSPNSTALRLSR